jgi:hypothetical protein
MVSGTNLAHFMDNSQQKTVGVEKVENTRIRPQSDVLSILHHIVQSINKLLELAVLLHSELKVCMFYVFQNTG